MIRIILPRVLLVCANMDMRLLVSPCPSVHIGIWTSAFSTHYNFCVFTDEEGSVIVTYSAKEHYCRCASHVVVKVTLGPYYWLLVLTL
jgi:hypothetical protein